MKEQSGHNQEHQILTQKGSKHLLSFVIFWTIVGRGSGMNHGRQHLQYHHEFGEYPLQEPARLSSTCAGNSRYSNDAASLITKDKVSATATEISSAVGTVCRRVPILTPHQGSTRSGMVAKNLHFATCVAQPVFRSGVERLLRASSLPMPLMVLSCILWRLFFWRPFTLDEVRRTIFLHLVVGEVSRTISGQEHLANMIGCVAMRKTSERLDTTSERHENSGHFL